MTIGWPKCKIPGCYLDQFAFGLCSEHYLEITSVIDVEDVRESILFNEAYPGMLDGKQ